MIEINGQDGGGQILRSALSLSMITGQAFRMKNIRGLRSKPGLMRQHLTCVNAALEVCGGSASGNSMHSTELLFQPGTVKSGDYDFQIGTAGSTTLLFQTVLPALMLADGVSTVKVHGGTHNPMAPTADFIERSFLPQLRNMGVAVDFSCLRCGFAPAGGGIIRAEIHPCKKLDTLHLTERGKVISQRVECLLANVRGEVAEKELASVKKSLSWDETCYAVRTCDDVDGSGNALYLEEAYEHAVLHITSLGAFKKSAGKVASNAVKAYHTFTKSKAAIGTRLADQLLLPMALAGSGELITVSETNHIRTNIQLIEQFLELQFTLESNEGGSLRLSVNPA